MPTLASALEGAEALILLVDHQEFRELDPQNVSRDMPGRVAIDTRGVWDRGTWKMAGFNLHVLGVGEADV
jgi:UDP-N-acetyl-D-mannosaminuronate dehydrogenase